ncbi:DUF6903 family protein [Candidatus Agathobaculum pullicola]|uniref:DUF6903 family protein n=1 Tax=Candidatus Agathobaculum pullicola TaxID=2838426 RepID=UPI003F92E549
MKFWIEHTLLRVSLIALFFIAGLAMIIGGWKMTGQMSGLIVMIVGVALLIVSLAIYNKPFQDPKR